MFKLHKKLDAYIPSTDGYMYLCSSNAFRTQREFKATLIQIYGNVRFKIRKGE
jgi:hypothetical protein